MELALTYDDVLLVPRRSDVRSRRDCDTSTRLSRHVVLAIPIVSANMDTVTESRLAAAMALEGGIGIIHRFMTIEQQAAEVSRVKRPESIVVRDVQTLAPRHTLKDAWDLLARTETTSVLVVEPDERLVGILTVRDLLFEDDPDKLIGALMTQGAQLVTAPVGTSQDEAKRLLHEHRIEKLPLVDEQGRLRGLITARDLMRVYQHPRATRDAAGRLRVGAAVGVVGDYRDRAEALVAAGADVLVVDIAHGHAEHALKACRALKQRFPDVDLIAGNVATAAGTQDLIAAGVDAVKVGVGPGAACTTRIVTGVGVPQLTAVLDCVRAAAPHDVPIIADGGVRASGDLAKALAAGAASVMIGSLLAGTEESPGATVLRDGVRYKVYRGMASESAAIDRYRRLALGIDQERFDARVPEGVETVVPHRGHVSDVVFDLTGGLRSAMSYLGARCLREFAANAQFVRITQAGLHENHPHAQTTYES
ncbi:MAG TPA: IMP dehydrogenase [Chloroflexota bacterium]|nr:IMP dehydrogenase [Chloroflexota bacterium]